METKTGLLLQIIWNGGQFFHDIFGTYDLALILTGFFFNILGVFLSALGKVALNKENVTPTPDPNPSPVTFIFKSRKTKIIGSFIIIFFMMSEFAPSFTDIRLLIGFAFMVGLLNYLLTDGIINWGLKLIKKIPGFNNADIDNEINSTEKK